MLSFYLSYQVNPDSFFNFVQLNNHNRLKQQEWKCKV